MELEAEERAMGYTLGVDLGTTYTAAAIDRDGALEVIELGTRSAAVPSVVFLCEDGTVLTGEAAARRGVDDPGRLARDFKRRMGDTTPVLLGGCPYSIDALLARQLEAVVAAVQERQGGDPSTIAVAHPANWGPYKIDLLRQAVSRANLEGVVLLSEPEAAAIHYASQSRLEPGATIAVYDLGGGTFDVAVMRTTDDGFELLGEPEGIERLGGIDFDQAVLRHVAAAVRGAIDHLDLDDPVAQSAMARLHDECVRAKEALSSDTEVTIPVILPAVQTRVRLTRSEFEAMIRPALADTMVVTHRALRSAGVTPEQLHAVLLVGGSSRIPLIAQMVASEFGRPIALDAHPKHAVALGASIVAARQGEISLRPASVAPLATGPAGAGGGAPNGATTDEPTVEMRACGAGATAATAAAGGAAAGGAAAGGAAAGGADGGSEPPGADVVGPSWPQPSYAVTATESPRRNVVLVGAIAAAVLLIGGLTFALTRDRGGPTVRDAERSDAPATSNTIAPEATIGGGSPASTTSSTLVASGGPVPPDPAATAPPSTTSGPTTTVGRSTTTTVPRAPRSPPTSVASPPAPGATPLPTAPVPAASTTTTTTTDPPRSAVTTSTTAPTTTTTTTTTTATAPPPPPPLPVVGGITVDKLGGGQAIFTAPSADRCGAWTWSLSGTTFITRSGGSHSTCIGANHSWDTRWNAAWTLSNGSYTVTLTLTNAAGSRSSSQQFSLP